MLFIKGEAKDINLTGTLYEEDDDPPSFKGAPEDDAPYVWICDEFYEVKESNIVQKIDNRRINVHFEPPTCKGFRKFDKAIEVAKKHIKTQFARIGIKENEVELEIKKNEGGNI